MLSDSGTRRTTSQNLFPCQSQFTASATAFASRQGLCLILSLIRDFACRTPFIEGELKRPLLLKERLDDPLGPEDERLKELDALLGLDALAEKVGPL